MTEPETLTTYEKNLLLSVINHAIAYRLNTGSRRTELHSLKEIKRKLDLTKDRIKQSCRNEYAERDHEKTTPTSKKKRSRDS